MVKQPCHTVIEELDTDNGKSDKQPTSTINSQHLTSDTPATRNKQQAPTVTTDN
jgi:hypothetical protein